jgi:uncharacterized protein (TIGR03032 family)
MNSLLRTKIARLNHLLFHYHSQKMSNPSQHELNSLWAKHHAAWRDPGQIASHGIDPNQIDPALFRYRVRGAWWEAIAATGATLLVTREYEHLILALRLTNGQPEISYMSLPHPSGLAVDLVRQRVHIASTRNPNMVLDLAPVIGLHPRLDDAQAPLEDNPLVPVRTRYLPGCTYMHDLALIGGQLHANSVGQNAVVRIDEDGGQWERVWWPRCIEQNTEKASQPVFGQNYIQLNSIAAGNTLAESYFSASSEKISARRPGHQNFPVDKRGVIFSGATREPMARGLTRPHSARLYGDKVWVDNSGYGEFGFANDGRFEPVLKLPGWTRGLGFHRNIAFVGTSRVLPRFRQYAPGLDVDKSICGLHAVDMTTGQTLGSLLWPYGNQIFAIEVVPFTSGFPFRVGTKRSAAREKSLFYAFQPQKTTNQPE